ncbi:MAG TPA: electron transport complex subunit E [Clostridiaceae bacterium]|nr:electron transport complex subunit E [Clostridiaceae bacterium]
MNKSKEVFFQGFIKENPIFRLVLGMCSSLAVSSTMIASLGMGVSVIFVLVLSNIVISSLRKVIPDMVRIPAFITVIAGFVTIVQLLLKAYLLEINNMLGVYLPLIVVNCIILGRAEAFAAKNSVGYAALDGLGMGIGYTIALLSIAFIRELFGFGSLFGFRIIPEEYTILILTLPAGGFLVLGFLMAVWNKLAALQGKPKAELHCQTCPVAGLCGEGLIRLQKTDDVEIKDEYIKSDANIEKPDDSVIYIDGNIKPDTEEETI